MNRWLPRPGLCFPFALAVTTAICAEPALKPSNGTALLPAGAIAEKFASGFGHTEGPAWHPDGFLIFSNPPNDRVVKLDDQGVASTFRSPSGRTTALFFDPAGRLVANESHGGAEGNRRVTRREQDGTWTTLADRFEGKRFNSPNDLAIDAKGRIYFTDPRYSLRETMQLTHESVYRIDPSGAVTRLAITLTRPNGIGVTADGRTLLVSDNPASGDAHAALWAYDLDAAGAASNGRIVYRFSSNRGIDGLAFDSADRIWATSGIKENAGITVLELNASRVGANVALFFPLPETPTNCVFGGAQRDILYITAEDVVFRLRTHVTGRAGPPGK